MVKNTCALSLEWERVEHILPLSQELEKQTPALQEALKQLCLGTGPGASFLGWLNPREACSPECLSKIKQLCAEVSSHSNAVVVVGIGGSLLGTKAIFEALTHSFASSLQQKKGLPLFWAGHHLASDELSELLEALENYSPTLVVVSKSGGTTEPALAFRILKNYLEKRYTPQEVQKKIIAITDPQDGVLLQIAKTQGYQILPIPKNVGGRYSVFSAVGLLPLALAGISIESLLKGAQEAYEAMVLGGDVKNNLAMQYAGIRTVLYQKGYKIESLCSWSPKLKGVAEWWKQLFGESDGKEGKGIFPASAHFTTDLHSLGQYFQEGERHLFATHLTFQSESDASRFSIPSSDLQDGFEFLAQKSLAFVQQQAQEGTFLAHTTGKLPTLVWRIPELSEFWLGYWLYTNMLSCGLGGYLLKINPFNQPGVEEYKKNMFALLGKKT